MEATYAYIFFSMLGYVLVVGAYIYMSERKHSDTIEDNESRYLLDDFYTRISL